MTPGAERAAAREDYADGWDPGFELSRLSRAATSFCIKTSMSQGFIR